MDWPPHSLAFKDTEAVWDHHHRKPNKRQKVMSFKTPGELFPKIIQEMRQSCLREFRL